MCKWWKNKRLENPIVILLRLLMYPIIIIARIVMCMALAIGWGGEAANDFWQDTI